jgi:hypothetical protein
MEPLLEEFIFKTAELSVHKEIKHKKFVKFQSIVGLIIYYCRIVFLISCVLLSYPLITVCKQPGGAGFLPLFVYLLGLIIWAVALSVFLEFILKLKKNSTFYKIKLPGLILTILGFLVYNVRLISLF